jgi:HD superfamily phosphodiesterase
MFFFTKLFQIVNILSAKYNIDESHGLLHSMQIVHYANDIYQHEKYNYPILQSERQKKIIYVAAVLHDMCDKKYVNETEGMMEIREKWNEIFGEDEEILDIASKIINSMSYSKVKVVGFPELGDYQMAYHIVREADLLCAYDFDRSMIYHMRTRNCNLVEAYHSARNIFNERILRHNVDNLFVTDYSKRTSITLHVHSIKRLLAWNKLLL